MNKFVVAGLLFSLLISAIASADNQGTDQSSAYFGFGVENIRYSETLMVGGRMLRSEYETSNLMQRSGSYVAINKNRGFYINTTGTLLPSETEERWHWGELKDIKKNYMMAERYTLDLLGTRRFSQHHGLIGGVRYTSFMFNRYAPSSAEGTAAIQAIMPDFNPDDPTKPQMIEEKSISFSLAAGYEFDSFFIGPASGLKWNSHVLVGAPFYSEVTNTSVPTRKFADSFGGYDVSARGQVAWQFSRHVVASLGLAVSYIKRDQVTWFYLDENNEFIWRILPDNEVLMHQWVATAHWSF